MASEWLKALHCKSNVVQDVYHHHQQQQLPLFTSHKKKPKPPPTTTTKTYLLPLGCSNSSHTLLDVVPHKHHHHQHHTKPRKQTNPTKPTKPTKQCSNHHHHHKALRPKPPVTHFATPSSSPFPTLNSLPHGHSSRRVIEIIFTSSWSPSSPFPGVIDMLFKVHNPPVALALFEAHRAAVRARAGPSDPRCAADGNEMMRFHSPAEAAVPLEQPGGEPVFDAGFLGWSSSGGDGVRTFAGGGGAHESGRVDGRRRAMVVCRVIAGRVGKDPDKGPDVCESVALGKGELLVFDRSALLPCFLIIYRL